MPFLEIIIYSSQLVKPTIEANVNRLFHLYILIVYHQRERLSKRSLFLFSL